MKRFFPFCFFVFLMLNLMAQKTTTLTFSAKNQFGQWVQLKNIVIENITKGWQLTITYPDTTLVLTDHLSVSEQKDENECTVFPNPFDGTTEFALRVQNDGTIGIVISDMTGRVVAETSVDASEAGFRANEAALFRVRLEKPQTYLLRAWQEQYSVSKKLINIGNGGANEITKIGTTSRTPMLPTIQMVSNSPFESGDLMRYIGFASVNGKVYTDLINQAQNGSEKFVFTFVLPDSILPPTPPTPPVVACSDTLIVETASICNGALYHWHGSYFSAAGVYYDSLKSVNGNCDSVYQLNLSSHSSVFSSKTDNFCLGSTYFWNGKPLTSAGAYYDTLQTIYGCDSVCELVLNGITSFMSSENGYFCLGDAYFWHGKNYASAGKYYDTLQSVNGCDSICELNLANYPASFSSENGYFCLGDTYFWHGKNYASAGKYYDTLQSVNGCDSICELNLANYPVNSSTENATACVGHSYYWHGKNYANAGIYYDTLQTMNGCDSVCKLVLTLSSAISTYENASVCPGHSYYWHGAPYAATGTYADTLTSVYGCDSICHLTLSYYPTYSVMEKDSIYSGSSLYWHGKVLTSAGTYYDTLYTVNGCDSAFQLVLTLRKGPQFTCGISTVTDVDGNTYNTLQLGTQCWMKENLKTTRFANGTPIPLGTTSSSTTAYYYHPNVDASLVPTYGELYNWTAAVNSSSPGELTIQGVCPDGWHLPSKDEYTTLINFAKTQSSWLCNSYYIAKAVASNMGWMTATQTCAVGNNQYQNNASGLGLMPAGLVSGTYANYLGEYARLWSSTIGTDISEGTSAYLSNTSTSLYTSASWGKDYGFSVRCVYGKGGRIQVSTSSISSIGSSSATCGGYVADDGGDAIVARGICWSTAHNPTIADAHTTDGAGLGGFTSSITGMVPNTPYYIKAYATNSFGTAYGEEVAVVIASPYDGQPCSGASTVTDYENNTYNTIQIGKQCWMKENLRSTKYSNGASISFGGVSTSTSTPYYYYPYANSANKSSMGLLYNVAATFNGSGSSTANPSGVQGICPSGWHLPSRAECTQLTEYVAANPSYQCNGTAENYANSLASTSGWSKSYSTCEIGYAPATNNATGFSMLPAGTYDGTVYSSSGTEGHFWTTYKSSSYAYQIQFSYYSKVVYQFSMKWHEACSVRCVKN